MADSDDELGKLRGEVAALREELAGLRAQVDATRGVRATTMRRDACCPGCGARKLLMVSEILDRAHGGDRKLSVAERGAIRHLPIGQFALVICASCFLVEWYVHDVDQLPVDGKKIRIVDSTVPGSGDPYR